MLFLSALVAERKKFCHKVTKKQRKYLNGFLSALVPWWRKEKSFATKSTKFEIRNLTLITNKSDYPA